MIIVVLNIGLAYKICIGNRAQVTKLRPRRTEALFLLASYNAQVSDQIGAESENELAEWLIIGPPIED